ncbi:hypothetical protein FQN50_005942 [Emmonsiellopsis sp. PD_5]|nr:hypothetical protein FQN50_005942 [Emmonsiellopsis sp. PD_5]
MKTKTDTLIIGAGPTGLVLALWLTRQGISVRIIDKHPATASTSRALVIHARTLELYRQLDLADEVVANGHKIEATNVWVGGVHKGHVPFGDAGKGLTPYPFIHVYPQDQHEMLLERRLEGLGVRVERFKELVDFTEHEEGVTARLRDTLHTTKDHDDSELETETETCEASFIIGCDGAHSAVRHCCNIPFEGETYSQAFFVADVEGSGPIFNGQAHVTFNANDFFLMLAYDRGHRGRLNGAIDTRNLINKDKDISELTFNDVTAAMLQSNPAIRIDKVNWFTTYHVHHRLAQSFRSKGSRAFLAGDAGHIHSPVGGQGMNTGIGDAVNLAWKLAAVIRGEAGLELLDSYEVERRAFAEVLLGTTDSAFNFIVSEGYMAYFMRTWVIPVLAPWVTRVERVRKMMFARMSQTLINYRHSKLAGGEGLNSHSTVVVGGDRLPWAPVGDVDSYECLKEITWQVHVYGAVKEELRRWCEDVKIPLHVFEWDGRYGEAGLGRDVVYLIRPDTYVAVADGEAEGVAGRLEGYLKDNGIRLG